MKVISGGQTGIDRAALDAAIEVGLEHGGFVPKGRRAEDGPLPEHYKVWEADSEKYPKRTYLNVQKANATLVVCRPLSSTIGVALTMKFVREMGKPFHIAELDERGDMEIADEIVDWLSNLRPDILNVAGHRESRNPGVYERTKRILTCVFRAVKAPEVDQQRLF